jgi:serine/threonine-protein kinase
VLEGHAGELNLGPYRLIDIIGEGGMGFVFKAHDQRLNRFVALKTIRDDVLDKHPEAAKRFHREAQAAAQLAHPNVVVLYEKNELDGIRFLAMEFVDGIDLHRMVQQQGPLPIPVAVEYIKQAAAGLQHAHESGLIHRDIKPSNLLVTRPGPGRLSGIRKLGSIGPATPTPLPSIGRPTAVGTIKILDMGLARLTETNEDGTISALTHAGSVIGTPDFIAPEQARDASLVDHRADLYSLGCTFYFVLTGRPPFPEGTSVEKLVKHQSDEPIPLDKIRRGVPLEVLQVVQKLMEKNVNTRFQTAQEVIERLSEIQRTALVNLHSRNGESTSVINATSPVADPPATGQYGLDSIVIPARKIAVLHGHTGYVTALSFSPDGHRLASGGLDGVVQLWEVDSPKPSKRATLKGHLGEVQSIAFAPHKPYLVTGSAPVNDARMWRWHWDESNERCSRAILPGAPHGVDALAFTPDGKRLAACSGGVVVFWNETRRGLERESVLKGNGASVKAAAFSPDGKRLALAGDDTLIRFWEFGWLRTSQKAVCEGHTSTVTSIAFSPNGRHLASSGPDRIVRVWDATASGTLRPTAELQAHTSPVRLVRFTARADTLVSVGDGGQVFLWDVAAKSVLREWMIDKAFALSHALSPDGRWLTAGMNDGQVFLYDLELILMEQMPDTTFGN